jgi:hypothetical protein
MAGAVAAAALASAPAGAAVLFEFTPGGSSPTAGYSVINTFDDTTGISGSGFAIKTPPTDNHGAVIPNSSPAGTPYLSVFRGGSATIGFDDPVSGFQFDWGSLDAYNTLTIFWNGGQKSIVPGVDFASPADGNQFQPGTNGLFTVWGNAGETFTGFRLQSADYSFEIDNLAVASAVPEPAAWALMITGFGLTGAVLRRRRRLEAHPA